MILVTGASGFVGRHLVRYLSARGHSVRALYRSNLPGPELLALPGVEWQRRDLLDVYDVEEALEGVREIYHCAAVVSFHPAKRQEMMHMNVESTANLVNEALLQDVRKMVYLSSVAALGRNAHTREITEEEQWEESRQNSAYGQSKQLAELEVWRAIGEGLNAVIINPGIILGEGNWNEGSARLMKVVYEEFPFYTRGINAFVDVQDVVAIMYRLMEAHVSAERFIVSAGNFAYREIFEQMARALGRKPPRIAAGPFLTGLVWRWNMLRSRLTGCQVTVTKETARNAQKQCYYNNTRLLQQLPGFAYTPMEQTIARMAQVFMSERNGAGVSETPVRP